MPSACRRSSRRFAHSRIDISAPTPVSTPPTTSSSAISGTPGRCAAPATRHASGRAPPAAQPDVTISTDATTWLALRQGSLSGIDAFVERRLNVRGNLDHAIAFEGMFRLPGWPPAAAADPRRPSRTAPHLFADHGSRSGRAAPARAWRHTRLATRDRGGAESALPGSRARSPRASDPRVSPPGARYNARWFAEALLAMMDQQEIATTHIVGNSMGGRIAIEMALMAPERVRAPGAPLPGGRLGQARLSPAGPAAPARIRAPPPRLQPPRGGVAVLEHVLRPRSDRSRRGRSDGG